jgi:hypothetical protein
VRAPGDEEAGTYGGGAREMLVSSMAEEVRACAVGAGAAMDLGERLLEE